VCVGIVRADNGSHPEVTMEAFREAKFQVEGMTCGACVRHVNGALRKLRGVADVEVQLAEGTVRVVHDPAQVSTQTIIDTLGGAGYPAQGATAGPR
jgi:copper chaperone